MDFEKLEQAARKFQAPEPKENAKNKAISAGLSAFKEHQQKNANSSQGRANEARPIGVIQLLDTFFRRFDMKKAYAITGGLSVAAIAALLLSSTSLYKQVVPVPAETATNTPPVTVQPTEPKPQPTVEPAQQVQATAQPAPTTIVPAGPEAIEAQNDAPVKEREKTPAAKPAEEYLTSKVDGGRDYLLQDKSKDMSGIDAKKTKTEVAGKVQNNPADAESKVNRIAAKPASTPEMAAPVGAVNGQGALARANKSGMLRLEEGDSRYAPPAPPSDLTASSYHDEGRDKFENIQENPVKIVAQEPVSTFSVDVDTASYSFMRGELNRGELPQKDAVRVEEMINYFDYDYALPTSKEEPFQPNIAVYPAPWNTNHKVVQIGVKGYDIQSDKKPHANLTFLIDVSGSMDEPNKLPLLKQSMRMLVNELKADDTVAIVVYAGNAGTVLEPTKVKDKQKILTALDNLSAGGSTAGGEGINLAYKLAEQNFDKEGVNRVILATDGDFNVGITDPNELKSFIERKRDTGITLSVLGFGEGNYNDELMQKLAQNGNGNASYIDTVNEARKVLVNEAGSTLFTIAKDVKLQVEFNPAQVSEYRLIGYTTRILNREDFNNDKVDAGDIGAGHKVTALYEITPKGAPASVDPLRYDTKAQEAAAPATTGGSNEYAFLKIRYKLPDASTSKLITRPITPADDVKDAQSMTHNLGFAAAVAAFGQKLAGDSHLGTFSYDDIINLAKATKGEDEFGYRAEFIQLVRTAQALDKGDGTAPSPVNIENDVSRPNR